MGAQGLCIGNKPTPQPFSANLYEQHRLVVVGTPSHSVTFYMAVQRLQECTFNVGGSYSNVVSLNLVTNTYHRRATRTTLRSVTSEVSSHHQLPELLVKTEWLQRTINDLSRQIKPISGLDREYEDLINTLNDMAERTIPHVLRFSIDSFSHQLDQRCENRVLMEIAYMQRILDEFSRRQPSDSNQSSSTVHRTFKVEGFLEFLWSYLWWLFYARYIILTTRKSIMASRDRIYAALFEPMASSLGNPIRSCHTDIVDFFGAQWSLPQDLCLNRQVFLTILRFKYQGGPAELVVASKQFNIFKHDGLRAVRALEWEKTIKEGNDLQLSVLVNQRSEEGFGGHKCPQCERNDKLIHGSSLDGWVNCLRCNSTFNITPLDLEEDHDGEVQTDADSFDAQQGSSRSNTRQFKLLSIFRCFSITILKNDRFRQMRNFKATPTSSGTEDLFNPIDAPTQPRTYLTPSTTSRKEIPASFAPRRARSNASEPEDGKAPGPDATELEQIEYKRRQNTLAARRSRQRKVQYILELEAKIEELTRERDMRNSKEGG